MNNHELRMYRNVFGLSEAEAATCLGEGMGKKTWGFYERHHITNYGVKPYIARNMKNWLAWRKNFILEVLKHKTTSTPIVHYSDQNDFSDILHFKAHYSATTTLNIDYGYNLIVFDKAEYAQFIEELKLEDNEESKQRWADVKYAQILQIKSVLVRFDEALEAKKLALSDLCLKADFSLSEATLFINRLKSVSQKTDENYKEALSEYLAKMLPHTLHYAEKNDLKMAIVSQTTDYVETLKEWAKLYHQTKGLIEAH